VNANAKYDRTRRCFDNAEGWVEARIHDGEALADSTSLIGPCVVDYASTTIWVPCGFFGVAAKGGNLIIGREKWGSK
jgi:N-methylhydantoinase A/oxoprolinase/acetone carboxylase beta subunit